MERRELVLKRKREEYFGFIEQYYHSRTDEHHRDTYRQVSPPPHHQVAMEISELMSSLPGRSCVRAGLPCPPVLCMPSYTRHGKKSSLVGRLSA